MSDSVQTPDPKRAEAFAERFVGMLNAGATAIMISVGHRTGLFDVMAELPPSDCRQIAEAAGLNERYVREWLAAMVVGEVIEYDESTERYRLPVEHAGWLTRAATPNNMAVYAQYIPQLGAVEDHIIGCFRNGGGVGYEAYHRFHDIMAEDSGQTVLPVLVEQILPLAPGLVERLDEGIDVLDIGCGSGRAVNLLAKTYPKSDFLGVDLSEEGIGRAREEAEQLGLANIRFEVMDLTDFPVEGRFDLVTSFDAIHDQARPDKVLAGVVRVLREDGVFLMQDIGASSRLEKNREHILGPLLYTISTMHCMTVSLAQNDGMGLGTMWGEERAREMLTAAGFENISITKLPHDVMNMYLTARPGKQVNRSRQEARSRVA